MATKLKDAVIEVEVRTDRAEAIVKELERQEAELREKGEERRREVRQSGEVGIGARRGRDGAAGERSEVEKAGARAAFGRMGRAARTARQQLRRRPSDVALDLAEQTFVTGAGIVSLGLGDEAARTAFRTARALAEFGPEIAGAAGVASPDGVFGKAVGLARPVIEGGFELRDTLDNQVEAVRETAAVVGRLAALGLAPDGDTARRVRDGKYAYLQFVSRMTRANRQFMAGNVADLARGFLATEGAAR